MRRGNVQSRSPENANRFFAALIASGGSITQACQWTGLSHRLIIAWRVDDANFADAMQAAIQLSTEVLESEAIRRATQGVERVIYHKGKKIGTKIEYSDGLLRFILQSRDQAKYGARSAQVMTPPPPGPNGTVINAMRLAESNTQETLALAGRTMATYAVSETGGDKAALAAAKTGQK